MKLPDFKKKAFRGAVPSYHQLAWEGHKSGSIGVDSANRLHHVVRISERVDIGLLCKAVDIVAARHRVLRARVVERSGRPWLVHDRHLNMSPQLHDLSNLPQREREKQARALAGILVWKRVDFSVDALCRSALIRLGPRDYVFALMLHHFIGDAVSSSVLYREIQFSYYTLVSGAVPQLPPTGIQYADYLLALEEWRIQCAGRRHFEYWKHLFADCPPLPILGAKKSGNHSNMRKDIAIERDLSAALRELGIRQKTTTFTVLLAAQKILLARLTGLDDVTIAAVTDGRELPILRRAIGYFADRIYYRTSLAGNPSFLQVLNRVRSTIQEASRHPFIRFDVLQQELNKTGGTIWAPVFNFRPSAASLHVPEWRDPWQQFEIAPPPSFSKAGFSVCYYWMELQQTSAGLRGHVRSATNPMEGFCRGFYTVLRRAAEDPNRKLSELL